jgi:hypothetical protein
MSKIAVMGSAPSSRHLAPFNDTEWEIWCCSPPNYDNPRVDAWFELHNLDRKFGHKKNAPYIETIIRHPRVYIYEPDPRLPEGIVFPWRDYVALYGTDFFTSSIAWMMAHAISYKPEKIGLWGVDMAAATEYDHQRPGVKFFVREAKRQGIDIYCPPTSDIDVPVAPYAIREHWPMWQKMQARKKELTERKAAAESAIGADEHDLALFRGARDDPQYYENTLIQPPWLTEVKNVPMDPQSENTD